MAHSAGCSRGDAATYRGRARTVPNPHQTGADQHKPPTSTVRGWPHYANRSDCSIALRTGLALPVELHPDVGRGVWGRDVARVEAHARCHFVKWSSPSPSEFTLRSVFASPRCPRIGQPTWSFDGTSPRSEQLRVYVSLMGTRLWCGVSVRSWRGA